MKSRPLPGEIQRALNVLNDIICSYERNTQKSYTVVLVPCDPRERPAVSLGGKPVEIDPARAVEVALIERASAQEPT